MDIDDSPLDSPTFSPTSVPAMIASLERLPSLVGEPKEEAKSDMIESPLSPLSELDSIPALIASSPISAKSMSMSPDSCPKPDLVVTEKLETGNSFSDRKKLGLNPFVSAGYVTEFIGQSYCKDTFKDTKVRDLERGFDDVLNVS
jgi:hypothetical protein